MGAQPFAFLVVLVLAERPPEDPPDRTVEAGGFFVEVIIGFQAKDGVGCSDRYRGDQQDENPDSQGRSNWTAYPNLLYRTRCLGWVVRQYFRDSPGLSAVVLSGLVLRSAQPAWPPLAKTGGGGRDDKP